ncbi:hypothetical protein OPT61_g2279 [Boeremia exigua]|uniref:Uncharacterized protein n=1 Tax=Boeremia exigua TaxID=749465 RepID=A0ACC2IM22_9PLEO|nr:hypothetical protein OPT61_g2279 [Boeremia exigua]
MGVHQPASGILFASTRTHMSAPRAVEAPLNEPEPDLPMHCWRRAQGCSSFPDPGNVAIAVKTGATEAVEKIPMLMGTTLKCANNVMIFSDLEQNIAGYEIHDALADIPQSVMEGNSDFDFYHKLKDAQKYGQIAKMLRETHDPRISSDLASWTLDKYKQLHILEKLYAAHPDKDWYMMIDADTYIVWPNLLTWITQLPDPTISKLYLGSTANVGEIKFAHGGSGILLSQATMHEFAVVNKGVAASWDKPMHDECCGDYVIALALKKMGILLSPSWPTINGEKPLTLPFGPTHWCQPLVTMHHAQPNEMNLIANFELSRNTTRDPLTLAELFDAMMLLRKPIPMQTVIRYAKTTRNAFNSHIPETNARSATVYTLALQKNQKMIPLIAAVG